jgi:general stress protein 26
LRKSVARKLETAVTNTPHDFEEKLWKALRSDRTVMLGINGVDESHTRPMTAQFEHERGPIWFFTANDNAMVQALGDADARAVATFASKGHDLFATIHGRLRVDTDRAVVDRLWNRYVAAWFEGGKDDPKLALLRLDAEHAEVWIDASSVMAGVKLLMGVDPKQSYKDKVANVPLR